MNSIRFSLIPLVIATLLSMLLAACGDDTGTSERNVLPDADQGELGLDMVNFDTPDESDSTGDTESDGTPDAEPDAPDDADAEDEPDSTTGDDVDAEQDDADDTGAIDDADADTAVGDLGDDLTGDADVAGDTDAGADVDATPDTDADASDADVASDADADAALDADADADSGSDADTGVDVDADGDTGSDADSDTGLDADSDTGLDADLDEPGCQNGRIESPEHCDDGDNELLDGCDDVCRFELVHAISALGLVAASTLDCADTVFDHSFNCALTSDLVSLILNASIANEISAGGLSALLVFYDLSDDTILLGSDDPSITIGLPAHAADGRSPEALATVGAWYTATEALVDGRFPTTIPASYSGGVVTAGPLDLTITSVGLDLAISDLLITATWSNLSSPGPPPDAMSGAYLYPLDAAGSAEGQLPAALLDTLPAPAAILAGCNDQSYTACDVGTSPPACTSLDDVIQGGCSDFGGAIVFIEPTAPDMDGNYDVLLDLDTVLVHLTNNYSARPRWGSVSRDSSPSPGLGLAGQLVPRGTARASPDSSCLAG